MLKWFWGWWEGDLIKVEIIEQRTSSNHWSWDHTLVKCPDGTRKYVNGHLGKPGEIITVNAWDLKKY